MLVDPNGGREQYKVPYGAVLHVADGREVSASAAVAVGSHTHPVILKWLVTTFINLVRVLR